MIHTLMTLPFEEDAFEPYLSKETVQFHYGKHHAGYVKNLNNLILDTEYEEMNLIEIIKNANGALFNNAAQVYNHDFYWMGMSHKDTVISEVLQKLIERDFGSLETLKEQFLQKAMTLFGSGWNWLSLDINGKLLIEQTSNADNPLLHGHTPLLTCDVWEHAYYIDYRNARADYLEKWWGLVDWDFVSQNVTQHTAMQSDALAPCNDNSELCDYINVFQESEHTNS